MSTQNVSDEISQIDSFLKQLRSGAPPEPTKDAGEFQQTPPVASATPKDNGPAQSSAAALMQPHPVPLSGAVPSARHTLPSPTVPAELSSYQASKLVDYSSSESSSDGSSSDDSASTGDLLSLESDDSGASYERNHFGLVESGGSHIRAKRLTGPKVKGELTPDALQPLVERLSLELPEGCALSVCGKVSSVVEELIVIEGIKDSQPLDADTVLWNKDKTAIGKIFDIFGPVKLPYYSVRKTVDTDLKDLGIAVGDPVYCVPSSDAMTKYVFTERIQKVKGSDASWENDIEPPEEHLDYSDDEEERAARKRLQEKRKTEAEGEGQKETATSSVEQSQKKRSHKHKHRRKQHHLHQHEQHHHGYHQYGRQAPPPAFSQFPIPSRQQSSAIYSQDPSMQIYFQGMTENVHTGPLPPERVNSPLTNPLPHTASSRPAVYSSHPSMQNYFPRGNSPMYQAPSPLPGAGLIIGGPPQGALGDLQRRQHPFTSAGFSLGSYPWQQAPPTTGTAGGPSLIPPLLPSTPNIQQGGGLLPQQPAPQSSQQPLLGQSPSPETEI